PVELANVHTATGTKNLIFMTTLTGSLLAYDANSGQKIWQQDTHYSKITNSSPAIDPSGQFVYSYGVDGKIHKYAVETGQETLGSGWPERVTLMNDVEKGSSALTISKKYLYVTLSGYIGDAGHYEGHIVAIELATGKKTVFNVLCANIHELLTAQEGAANYCPAIQAGVWARAGAIVDPVTGHVFIVTGNGTYDANTGGSNYGDSVLELSEDVTHLLDSYTPSNFAYLQANDVDLGSTSPVMLPQQTGSSTPYLAVQGGKDNTLRLLNRENLSGKGGPNHVGGALQAVQIGAGVFTQPIAWNDAHHTTWLFVTTHDQLLAYKVVTDSQGHTSLQLAYQNDDGGNSPLIANNILFVQSDSHIRAITLSTGKTLWDSQQDGAGGSIGALHWQSPLVVNGCVYVVDMDGQFTSYGLK
ncbi:MAG: PQQ-like beta-propeller repeat protein, partial [Chloroflexota bacterium]|nr:PQQ-like beta-propeller repeat protein [Chloroflexota bacterium]